jgi:hypothetical protein
VATVAELREVADAMMAYFNYGLGLANFIAVELEGLREWAPAVGSSAPIPLPDKPPPPIPFGAPHVGERSENQLIASFVDRIAELTPRLVTFAGHSFDLPVLRYRSMINGVAAPGLSSRSYFHRYTEDAVDLCDVLSSFNPQGRATLHELSRVMGLPGKPEGISGSDVETFYRAGGICEIAAYCEADVINTYRAWLRFELFRGKLTDVGFHTSEANLLEHISGVDELGGGQYASSAETISAVSR